MTSSLFCELPFSSLSDFEISNMFTYSKWDFLENDTFVKYVARSGLGGNKSDTCPFNFKYYTEMEFNQRFGKIEQGTFSLFHLNVRSLNANCRSLCQFLELLELKFDVIVLTEICSFNITFYYNVLPEYRFFYTLPTDSRIGGVGIFVRNCYDVQELCQYDIASSDNNKVENMWLEVSDTNQKIIVGGIYRHPNQNFAEFRNKLENNLDKISNQSLPCIIAGDLNIDLVKSHCHTGTSQYVDSLFINNFMPTILMPTRITRTSATLIDHIYYYEGKHRNDYITVKSGNLLTDITDHLPAFTILMRPLKSQSQLRPKVRIFSKNNVLNFTNMLEDANWNSVYNHSDVNTAYNNFHFVVQKAFNASFPLKTLSKKRAKDKPWITSALKVSSNVKNSLYRKWLKTKSPIDEAKYKQYRNTFKNIAREAEHLYYKELFDTKTNSIKKLWENLNMVSSFKSGKQKKNNKITKLRVNNTTLTETEDICNAFNKYFNTVGQQLVDELNNRNPGSNKIDFIKYCEPSMKNSMFCEPVSREELFKLINNLKNSKSPGFDNIGPKLIKQVMHVVIDPLVYLYNLSFETGIVPDKLKIAKVVPVYKSGDSSLPNNYRPISLLSVFDKLLEKLMAIRLNKFLSVNNILYRYQFGFRKNYSTVLAVIDVVDNILEHLDKKETGLGIYLDLRKAFDTVDHDILLHKMYNYGIRGTVYDWFRSYVSNRIQYTTLQNINSTTATVTCGVPQGSVLGPLLFLIYMNDIYKAVPDINVKLFADDTNVFLFDQNSKNLSLKAADCLNKLNDWFTANKLSLNLTKTCYMVFSSKKDDDIKLFLNNIEIEKVQSCKYLGIYIDDELNWQAHVNYVYNKIIKFTGILYKLRSKLSYEWLKAIYFAFVYPHLLYGIEIYANTFISYLDRLMKLNNKILRIIQNQHLRFHVLELYTTFNLLPLDQLYNQQLLIFVFKCLYHNNLVPCVFHNYFTCNKEIHSHSTRAQNNLHIFTPNTMYGKRTIKYKCSTLWNNLPDLFKEYSTVRLFRCNCKKYLISKLLN